jgi:hypothetical protein
MNSTFKTICLTLITLSLFSLAMIEISGISTEAFVNPFKPKANEISEDEGAIRQAKVEKMPKTTMQFIDTLHDFGTINHGEKVRWSYQFTNTGNKPLMIENVIVSCGCTVPDFPKEEIAPGQQGQITLEFNSANKMGDNKKSALVKANTDNSPFPIVFTAKVVK